MTLSGQRSFGARAVVRWAGRGGALPLLFHLPVEYRAGNGLLQVEAALYRPINKHGRRDGDKTGHGYWTDEVIKLVLHDDPDGKYLIKGGGPAVWDRFHIRSQDRRLQGIIHGKRCGTTENIGPTARWTCAQLASSALAP